MEGLGLLEERLRSKHQSCASLVNASALCAIDGMSSVAEISAELQMEKQRNAELMERISVLEAQIHERNKVADGQGCCVNTSEAENRVKKFKRQKVEASIDVSGDGNNIKRETQSLVIHDSQCKDKSAEDGLVNWMSMDKTHCEKLKDIVECDADISIDRKDRGINENQRAPGNEEIVDDGMQIQSVSSSGKLPYERGDNPNSYCVVTDVRELKIHDRKNDGCKAATEGAKGVSNASISHNRKPPKVAFCPKEVKKVMESEQLLLKNAQSHTIRKIIVFASLGIRHGCEDMYELDLNHFSIVGKGEPHVSSKNPGEHVLYENPGGRRKVFYPNRQNPTLCPVRVLEEEKVMRPSDGSCPSCLFLCIKYGGRTRNLPQNEYVRQRMGRNKLKSFGPVMCRMAMLVNIRSGSFFFKALGITLLFMAGFPDDLVQRETKYRSLDLLQKYYRRDEDTEGEELFLPHPVNCDTADIGPQQLRVKTKPKGKKQTQKPHGLPKPLTQQSTPSTSTPPSQFGLMNYNSIQTHAMAAFQSMPCHTPAPVPNSNQNPYHMQPTNALMPMMFWPPPKAFPPCPYPSLYGFQSLPSAKNYITFHQQPYYTHTQVPQMVEGSGKNGVAPEESQGDSNSTSSS